MMDPINLWIDPNETRRMAERLMLPARDSVAAPENTGFDDSFIGFFEADLDEMETAAPETSAVGELPLAVAADAVAADAVEPAVDDAAAFSDERAMLRERFSALAAFMVNSHGDLIFNDGDFGAFQFVASNLAKSNADPVHVRLKVGARSVLEIIPIETDGGHAWLGVVLPSLLAPEAVSQIRLHLLGAQ